MNKILIIKTGALGDVVRTTPLLRALEGEIHWLTSHAAVSLLPKKSIAYIYRWESKAHRKKIRDHVFDTVINLEESDELVDFAQSLPARNRLGIFRNSKGIIDYHKKPGREWFDMGLISAYTDRDERKLGNRKTYQECLFKMVGRKFKGEEYMISVEPKVPSATIIGIEERSGVVWPMKQWSGYRRLAKKLEKEGYTVIFFNQHKKIRDYIDEIQRCNVIVCGDTLAMHVGLALQKQVVALFICTSPWEIYGYGRMKKIISPKLVDAFYRRDFVKKYVDALSLTTVYQGVSSALRNI